MRDVYERADKVLILDSLLYRAPFESPLPETMLNIMSSTWVNRLWTLQEIALAKQTYFQLDGGAICTSDLIAPRQSGSIFYGDMEKEATANYLFNIGQDFLSRLVHIRQQPLVDEKRLRTVCQAIVSRTTAKPHDETLCIASLLGREAKDYTHLAAEQRMKSLVTSLDFVLPEFLFCNIERYEDEGCRWIPRTLTTLTWHIKPTSCTHCPRGIRGTFSGFRIMPGAGMKRGYPTGVNLLVELEGLRLLVGGGFPGPNLWDERVEREMGVILLDPPEGVEFSPYRDGCFVTVSSIENGVIYAIRERDVMISDITEMGYMHRGKTPLKAVAVASSQQWCVG